MSEHHLFPPLSHHPKIPSVPFPLSGLLVWVSGMLGEGGAGKQHPLYSEAPFVSLQLFSQPVSYLILLGEKL